MDVIFSYLSNSAANLGKQNTWWTWCPALLPFRCDLDWNKSDVADGKKAGCRSERWQSQDWWSGCKCKAGGGTMSLWVILLTGNHAALIVVIGFPWKQKRLGTPKRNFIEFYFKGRQLAGALKTDILFASSGAVYFHVYLYIVNSAVSCKLEKWNVIAWLQHRRNWAVCGKDRWVSFVANKCWEKLMLLKFVKSKRHRSCRVWIKKCWQWKMEIKEGVRLHTSVSSSEYPSLQSVSLIPLAFSLFRSLSRLIQRPFPNNVPPLWCGNSSDVMHSVSRSALAHIPELASNICPFSLVLMKVIIDLPSCS